MSCVADRDAPRCDSRRSFRGPSSSRYATKRTRPEGRIGGGSDDVARLIDVEGLGAQPAKRAEIREHIRSRRIGGPRPLTGDEIRKTTRNKVATTADKRKRNFIIPRALAILVPLISRAFDGKFPEIRGGRRRIVYGL